MSQIVKPFVYDPNHDWMTTHKVWAADNERWAQAFYGQSSFTYVQCLSQIYNRANELGYHTINSYAHRCWEADTQRVFDADAIAKKRKIQLALQGQGNDVDKATNKVFLLTIGFDHAKYDPQSADKVIKRLLQKTWILRCKANLEMYRHDEKDDNKIKTHPHVHFYIETQLSKNAIMYTLGLKDDAVNRFPRYLQNITKPNFIQVDAGNSSTLDYINLKKIESKMDCVALDVTYRNENNIPDYEKNW